MLYPYLQYFKPTTLIELHEDLAKAIAGGLDVWSDTAYKGDCKAIEDQYRVLTGQDLTKAAQERRARAEGVHAGEKN